MQGGGVGGMFAGVGVLTECSEIVRINSKTEMEWRGCKE